jgi:pyrimidine deaminase RibD-like protein
VSITTIHRVALATLIAALALVFVFAVAAGHSRADQTCTHGASSIGPVVMRDGKIVGGDTTPHTESCLP